MNRLLIRDDLAGRVRNHLFQGELEEAAFIFARPQTTGDTLVLDAVDAYLVPPEGWIAQHSDYLELEDAERAHVLKLARAGSFALIDCHSHRGTGFPAAFSPSDRRGISEFAGYVRWKLGGLPYVATVWTEEDIDAVVWHDGFESAEPLHELALEGSKRASTPRFTWFRADNL